MWVEGKCPDIWKEATVIPIQKHGKDNTDPINYRPIALTSCLCKSLERMINNRLTWFLESNDLLTEFQCGFRNKRGTIDHLVRLETFIRDAFIKKEHLTAVFFDLEKAYDTTWKHGIIRDLHELGLKGRLPNFIINFLSNRHFKVRVGSTLSDLQDQEEGVPQGSILSVTLFSIKINNIVKNLNPGVDCSLYVDDFVICYRSKHIHTIERQLQQCLNKIQKWTNENGFKFSKTKTKCMHFCQLRKLHNDPVLKLDGVDIPVVDEYKFLGVIFDKKLSFIPHLKYLKTKCNKALQLLRVVAHTDWGADKKVLLRLYRSLVRSKLDYGCFIYGSARKSYLKILDTIHHQGLRIILGAFRTSPIESLYAETNEAPLQLRREKLALQYYLKLKSCPSNPAYECTFNPKYKPLFSRHEKVIKPFGIRMETILEESEIPINNIHETIISDNPPWTLKQPEVILDLTNTPKANTHPATFLERFDEIKNNFNDFTNVFTDGSKDDNKTGCAAVLSDKLTKTRIPNGASIFTAEIKGIDLALNLIAESENEKFIIFSDSLSVLLSLRNRKQDNPLIIKLLNKHDSISNSKTIVYCWIPSHIGISGNEKADSAAKSALSQNIEHIKIPYTDYKPAVNKFILNKWQQRWNENEYNKLFSIKPILGEWRPGFRKSRKEEVILSRIRIGHTKLTHSFILNGDDQPECIACQTMYTVKHFLIECGDLALTRQDFYNVNNLKELFDNVSITDILSFLRETNLYSKL